ncbi:MAG: glycosyltransferase [Saprospiraceae bacterium]|nr:glycosyltransferase [Saprospiraceae bacterium]MBK9583422.1 glycosyltransferase [Saprospiraceae bacterium]HQV66894.1 glycosyltransferase [Saprospiraceae bacterium]
MSLQNECTLLVPAYNPSEGWELAFLEGYTNFCKAIDANIPVTLINDGSSNDISAGVSFLQEKIGKEFNYLSYPKNRGKGGALKFGAENSYASCIMFTDIDFPYRVESMKAVWLTSSKQPGIITGYREKEYYSDVSNWRTFLSKGLRILNKSILSLPVNDTQCGLKAFDNGVKEILLQCETDRFLIDLELLLAVNKKAIPITPVPVRLREDIDFTKFNSSVLLKEAFNFIKILIKYRL